MYTLTNELLIFRTCPEVVKVPHAEQWTSGWSETIQGLNRMQLTRPVFHVCSEAIARSTQEQK